ncbi:phenylacetaldoxime dehydratase family protein [Caenimonas sedimenti]|uniref:Phenylacetaldoxime dehydratase family protein n=1 Tax=Caenimonas sedimenti TaxID=2596921 RepID=A0A562ZWR0_9BURK|nr:phenylacetaldoxime dehydratase family protein [Caenimonas sedimenti]TWO72758.1 phenylacetaldoxime dehydratase family protein [Caenimonas sedimenti]
MESAIPVHLQCPRTRQKRVPDDYQPPYPSFVARFQPAVAQVAMAYFGLQFRGSMTAQPREALAGLEQAFSAANAPGHWDRASHVDEAGYTNIISIAYWDRPAVFDAWFAAHGTHWASGANKLDGCGTFTEVLRPRMERFETLFSSSERAEGVAVVSAGMSDVVQEHAYWGGARDRMPASQTEALAPAGAPRVVTEGLYRRVVPHDNVCLIRSGQDWGDTPPEERRMYLEDVEPVLRQGMDFLRDDGLAIGCFANRYMRVLDAQGAELEKSFGMSWWKSLAALERWAESHPTHVAIFGAAMKYLSALGPAAKLKLYHEVSVATTDEQHFEYFNCHDRTGMLRA